MGVLTDKEIVQRNIIQEGLDHKVSYLNGQKIFSYGLEPHGYTMTLKNPDELSIIKTETNRAVVWIDPGEVLTLNVNELLVMPDDVVGFLYPKSSYVREGLFFSTAVVDAGFNGRLTISVFNPTKHFTKLFIDEGLLQIVFHESDLIPRTTYDGLYQEKH